jgi:hypothetical protein
LFSSVPVGGVIGGWRATFSCQGTSTINVELQPMPHTPLSEKHHHSQLLIQFFMYQKPCNVLVMK